MSVVVSDDFATGISGWTNSVGSLAHASGVPGPDGSNGVMTLAGNTRGYRSFTNQTTGKVRATIWFFDNGSAVGTSTYNSFFCLLPNGAAFGSANTAANFFIVRDNAYGATS